MINLAIFKENIIKQGKRIAKVIEFGAKTAKTVSSFGDDSYPLKDMTAIIGRTSERGDAVILGYINKNQIAKVGEKRIFSLHEDGTLSFSIHLKNDGTCEIGDNKDNAVRYKKLNEALQSEVQALNIELGKISTAIGAVGGTYTVEPITIDLTASKIEEIKVP